MVLGLETSCDDTCAALLTPAGDVRSSVVASQHVHGAYGGIVPELASRHHVELVNATIDRALGEAGATLGDVDLVAVTQGPGLLGALMVGLATGKALAAARRLALAPVDHLRAHVVSAEMEPTGVSRPFVCLVASGGHTLLARVAGDGEIEPLGSTLDDAAGEAIDKGARLLGLGYPGGPQLEALARDGDPAAFAFPVADVPGLDFSFAGVKTALRYRIRDLGEARARERRADLAASYQHAIVESLARRCEAALQATGLERLAVAGGVAANRTLRERLAGGGAEPGFPPPELCTDNAAMVAAAGLRSTALAYPEYLELEPYASGERPLAAAAGAR